MRLYSRLGATALDDGPHHYEVSEEHGGFDFPDELSNRLHRFHVGGQPAWETDVERQHRLINEELERRKDPATLLEAVQQLVKAAQSVSAPAEPAPAAKAEPEPAPPASTPAPTPAVEAEPAPKPASKPRAAKKTTASAAE